MTSNHPAFPTATLEDWRREVESGGGEEAVERLRSETLDGVAVDPLYARKSAGPPLPLPRGGSSGWECWASLVVPTPVDGAERVDEVWRLGANGLRLHLAGSARAADVASILEAVAERGVSLSGSGTAAAAILAAAVESSSSRPAGCLGIPAVEAAGAPRLAAEAAAWVSEHASAMRAFVVSSEPPDDLGAGAVFELAWMMAGTLALVRAAEAGGTGTEETLRRTEILLPVGRDVYLQIAKLRAARILWSLLVASLDLDPGDAPLRLLARTSWRTKTRWDAKTNLLRETVEGFAAVVGGCDALLGRPFDGGVGELGRRLRQTLPLVLRDEGRLADVEDPAAGSFALEAMTRRLAEDAWNELRRIESEGGLLESLSEGALPERMAEVAATRIERLRTRRDPVTGISLHPRPEADPVVSHQRSVQPGWVPAETSWDSLVEAAQRGDRGSVEVRLAAADRLVPAAAWSDAEAFERFRDRAASRERPPRALLLGIGSARDLSAPLGFARQLLVAGGFAVDATEPREDVEEAVADLDGCSQDVVVLVLPRDAGPGLRAEAAAAAHEATTTTLAIMGRDEVPGVAHRLYAGCDALAVLEALWEAVAR